ncbi:MAG: ComEC/Rec2 family competence protein [Deltaproteobacteria bacterium]|nr:MAG: ComEC/Rec2 family competence protein [Deltaproteobacteria bacterium]
MTPVYRPLAYVFTSFCFGIAGGRHLPATPLMLVILVILLCAFLVWRTARGHTSIILPPALFLVLGMLASAGIPDPDKPPDSVQQLLQRKSALLIGAVTHTSEQLPNRVRMSLSLEAFKQDDGWRPIAGNMILNIRQCRKQWLIGQRLIGRVRLKPVRNFNNPGSFDYRQYHANQRTWVRGYARNDAELVPLDRPKHLLDRVLNFVRTKSRTLLEVWLPPDHANLYRALLLGERSALSIELRELLYDVGVGHLLAISGLHLGMVAGLAFLIFHLFIVRIPALVGRWGARPATWTSRDCQGQN